jgi:glyoxylase-like metal-dependent hydrolase (beta-lactamase superfamily II)
MEYLGSIGRCEADVAGAIITHPDADHCGGNAAFRSLCPGALILAHQADADLIASPSRCLTERYDFALPYGFPLPEPIAARLRIALGEACAVDVRIAGDCSIDVSPSRRVEVLHMPGHSQGHLIVFDAGERIAIITDAVLGAFIPTAQGRPAFAPTYRRLPEYVQTIDRLAALQSRMLLTSHFPPIDGESAVTQFLESSRAFVNRVRDAIDAELHRQARPVTMRMLIDRVGTHLQPWEDPQDPFVSYALCYPFAATLDEGVESGRLRLHMVDGIAHYELA